METESACLKPDDILKGPARMAEATVNSDEEGTVVVTQLVRLQVVRGSERLPRHTVNITSTCLN